MQDGMLQRVDLLFNQNRFKDAEDLLMNYLSDHPNDEHALYMLAVTLINLNQYEKSRELFDILIDGDPGNLAYMKMLAELDIRENKYKSAEEKLLALISQAPDNPEFYSTMSRMKLGQRNYDSAIYFATKSLELDPSDLTALNVKTSAESIIGKKEEAKQTVHDALSVDPNNPYTIANLANQKLYEGKAAEALAHYKEALSIDPTNPVALHGLPHAMKAKFLPYRLMLRFFHFMGRLSGKNSWAVIIGAYLFIRALSMIADSNPTIGLFVMPIVYILVGLFLLTWILNPLMNLYLLTNPYGKYLLDNEDKKMAKYVVVSLIVALVFFALYFILAQNYFLICGIFFVALLIPLGTMLMPEKESQKKRLQYYTLAIFVLGSLGALLSVITQKESFLLVVGLIGIFIYQWVYNAIVIKSGSRTYD